MRKAQSAPREQPWEEVIDESHGLVLGRTSSPNEELIALGAKARESRWPIDNG